MADGTESPVPDAGTATSDPQLPPPSAPLPAFPTTTEPMVYRPLSPLAIAAFGVGVVYALVVIVGGILALFSRTPWLLPMWTIVLPVVAVLTALVARVQIRRSENTQSGQPLSSWAIGLSVGVVVIYTMYYFGTFLAVRAQAIAFTDNWLKTIAAGKTDEAFFLTVKPPRKLIRTPEDRDEKAARRRTLELTHNNPTPGSGKPGMFSGFSGSEYVRLLQNSTTPPTIDMTGVKEWDYEKGGFNVTLSYQVTTDLASFPIQVKVHGEEVADDKDKKSRQWNVVIEETGSSGASPSPVEYTEKGKQLFRHTTMAREALSRGWLEALTSRDAVKLFASTLGPKERALYMEYESRSFLGFPLLADMASSWDLLRPLAEKRHKVQAGGLVRADDDVFWAINAKTREQIESEVKSLFDPYEQKSRNVTALWFGIPIATQDTVRIHYAFDVRIEIPQKDGLLSIEARVILGADLADLPAGKPAPIDAFRVESLELLRGRMLAPTAAGPGRGVAGRP